MKTHLDTVVVLKHHSSQRSAWSGFGTERVWSRPASIIHPFHNRAIWLETVDSDLSGAVVPSDG